MTSSISFIHISDIHFTKYSGDELDLDDDLRNEILNDIRDNAKNSVGNIGGILVCGDIAYSAKADEYEKALEFLRDMCSILKIPETSVFCVPGNHDVDQSVPKSSPIFLDMQENLEKDNSGGSKLGAYFRDNTSSEMLYHHIHEYNTKFAGKFSCNIGEKKHIWNRTFQLNDGSTLSIVGMNSVIISNHRDIDGRLMVIGEHQIPKRLPGVVNISLCHHPQECWKDHENNLKSKINERVHIQLYGHKHVQKISQTDNTLIIGSGAMHPSRSEKNWKPRYNWISVHVETSEQVRSLKVSVYPRVINDNNSRFIADRNNCDGELFKDYSLKLDAWSNPEVGSPNEANGESFSNQYIDVPSVKIDDNNVALEIEGDTIQTLVYRFFALPYISRVVILSKLNLIDEDDEGINQVDLIDKIILKARESQNLSELQNAVRKEYCIRFPI